MGGTNGRRRQCFQRKIAVGDRIHTIAHRPVKTERFSRHIAVNIKPGAGQSGSAERAFIHPRPCIGKTAGIARQHFDISQKMMAESDRLRRLQMGKARHDGFGMGLGLVQQNAHQAMNLRAHMVERVAHIKPEIGGHLVIARARRMQPPRRRADKLAQPRLNIHMNIFQRPRKGECAVFNLCFDLAQPIGNRLTVCGGNNPLFDKHLRMRQ